MARAKTDKEVTQKSYADIFRLAMNERNVKQVELADRLGVMQSSISGNLNRRRIGLEVFNTMLDALDYDVAVVDRTTGEIRWIVAKEK